MIEKGILRYDSEQLVAPINLPADFRLDTIQRIDTARNLSTFILMPISGISDIDKVVFDEIEKQKNDFIKSLDERIEEDKEILNTANSDFQTQPVSVFKDNKVISILFIISYYHGGAPHPMAMYYSFNFDNKTLNRIFFPDYFIVKSKSDTSNLAGLITKAIGREGVSVSDLKDIDFNIEKDTISFNFDDYEIASYAEGIMQGRLHRHKLVDKIKTTYR